MYMPNESYFADVFKHLTRHGKKSSPRGQETIELENFSYTLAPRVRYNAFEARKFSTSYLKKEMRWYINADMSDLSILDHAGAWKPMVKDGKIQSCYGHYWFKRQTGVHNVVTLLKADPFSRRAVIPMLGTEAAHGELDAADVPCTTSIEFRIREGRLNARAVMRSQDAVWGMGNDVPTFSFLQEVIATLLGVEMGTLTVSVGSFHVYARHFDMASDLATSSFLDMLRIDEAPPMVIEDAMRIASCRQPDSTPFGLWLASE